MKKQNIFCRGIYSDGDNIEYIEWKITKRIDVFHIKFQLDHSIKSAKFKIRKGNGGTIIGTGGWIRKTGEKSSLNMTFIQSNNTFKMDSRYSRIRIQGLCDRKIHIK